MIPEQIIDSKELILHFNKNVKQEFIDNFTADDTEDFYEYASKHDAILEVEDTY